ncbi:ribosome maturation factor RimM [Tunturibacter empetritectus]|uniref:Ribosome maturation factor RimM n=1 Tax=Tunturiibacter empetritectus TaxID=3069691 RepID=A0A7W8IFI9_9BACT|nr:ribosome maturation factor RimM [Edaphobacter lichenicola]MBB5316190.1 16S rRNA processing protein RimM [Edaphobacter lichenicola]
MTQIAPAWIVLAHLLRPQGRKGEVLAELLTDFPERFEEQTRVFLAASGFEGKESEARAAEVVAFWLPVGKNEGRIVLQFAGIETISDAEAVAGLDVIVPREERRVLDDDSVYISELIGCTVYDGAAAVGVVEDVQFATTADGARRLTDAAPLLEITSLAGDEILIPFVKAFLVAVDTEAKRIEMKLPEGLIEVNRSSSDKS